MLLVTQEGLLIPVIWRVIGKGNRRINPCLASRGSHSCVAVIPLARRHVKRRHNYVSFRSTNYTVRDCAVRAPIENHKFRTRHYQASPKSQVQNGTRFVHALVLVSLWALLVGECVAADGEPLHVHPHRVKERERDNKPARRDQVWAREHTTPAMYLLGLLSPHR